ncbi:MAG: SGNH/GDSL hydrolase family protein [Planctomycetota bacterium]|jgi:lysophospholipase L1-like esterase
METTLIVILIVVLALVAVEVVFRIVYRRCFGRDYHVAIKFPWDKMHVVAHPYLSFAYRRNGEIDRNQELPYPLHTNRFYSFRNALRLNNLGHFGDEIPIEKREGVVRIACLGASTTANNIADRERDYSYPKMLEELVNRELQKRDVPTSVEVFNCGIGGWVSPDILINFALNILPTRPDYVVLYHGFNDLHLYLTEDFATDYSHGRTNLGEHLPAMRRAHRLPKIKFWHSYECLKDSLLGTGNVRNDVLGAITTARPDVTRPYHDLGVERDILKNILVLCRHHGIRVVLSSFAYRAYRRDAASLKYRLGVEEENRNMRSLAEEFGTLWVDQAALIPQQESNFVDAIHFSPAGMKALAENFGKALVEDIVLESAVKTLT